MLHVGDYHYRENACPDNVTGCQGSPWSYGFDAWEADLFRPGASLMHAAPWIMVRGNHEECLRGGQGWFRFLETRPYSAEKSCDLAANDSIANYNDPYAVPIGSNSQVIVFDSAKAGAAALNPSVAADAPIFATYQAELAQAAQMAADPSVFSIWANHHPLLGYTPVAGANPTGGQASILSVMSAAYGTACVLPAEHRHAQLSSTVTFTTCRPSSSRPAKRRRSSPVSVATTSTRCCPIRSR